MDLLINKGVSQGSWYLTSSVKSWLNYFPVSLIFVQVRHKKTGFIVADVIKIQDTHPACIYGRAPPSPLLNP